MLPREDLHKNETHNFTVIWIVSCSMTHHFVIERPQKESFIVSVSFVCRMRRYSEGIQGCFQMFIGLQLHWR